MSLKSDDWPQLHPSFRRRLHIKISDLLLGFGGILSDRNSEWFKSLQHRAEREPYDTSSSLPEDADVELEHLLYGDLYAVEDFEKLKYGIDQLFRDHESKLPTYRSRQWHEWVDQLKGQAGGWVRSNVGYLDLSDACTFFSSCHVAAFGTEGYITLGLGFTPSDVCKDEFEKLLAEGGEFTTLLTLPNLFEPVSNLSLLSWVRYSLGFRQEPRSSDLQRKIDRLFLRCNREVADLLESYIGSGLALEKPLPSLEIISTDISRDQLLSHEEERERGNSSERSLNNRFWTNIGQRHPPTNPWRWEWGQLYRTRRSDEYNFRSHQMVVHRPDLVQLEDYRIGDREPGEGETRFGLALRAYLRDRTSRLGAVLAIREQFLRFRDRLIYMRNLLSPQLRTRSSKRLPLKVLWNGKEVLAGINAVHFSQKRLWSQVKDKRIRSWLFRAFRGAKRSGWNSEETVDFVDDWAEEVEALKSENQSRLERVESAYDKLFTIVNARATILLQLTLAMLTVLLLWLTTLMVMNSS